MLKANESCLNLDLQTRTSVILQKISKWMNPSARYNVPSDGENLSSANADFVKLTGMSNFTEIEGLMPPKDDGEDRKGRRIDSAAEAVSAATNNGVAAAALDKNFIQTGLSAYSLNDMISGIDADILQYLNPMETNFSMNESFHFASDLF